MKHEELFASIPFPGTRQRLVIWSAFSDLLSALPPKAQQEILIRQVEAMARAIRATMRPAAERESETPALPDPFNSEGVRES